MAPPVKARHVLGPHCVEWNGEALMVRQSDSMKERGSEMTQVKKQHRGFAAMDPKKRSAIAGMGGRAAHAKGVAHQWTKAEAQAAGRKGGAQKAMNAAAAK